MVPESFENIHFFTLIKAQTVLFKGYRIPGTLCLSNSICNFVIYQFGKQASKALVEVYKLIVLVDQIELAWRTMWCVPFYRWTGIFVFLWPVWSWWPYKEHDKLILPIVFCICMIVKNFVITEPNYEIEKSITIKGSVEMIWG